MAKVFAPRISKKNLENKTHNLSQEQKALIKVNDERLLEGAVLDKVLLSKITVNSQVRTHFNDSSIKELAQNIKANGLIQPLVIHREGNQFVLICGERRFRAMKSIDMEKAPCFILEGKSKEELMAVQFSENSAREELHYVDKADGIYNYHLATNASERKIVTDLGISKSEVHRGILIGKLPEKMKQMAKEKQIEKYVLLEYGNLEESHPHYHEIGKKILEGKITKRSQLKEFTQM